MESKVLNDLKTKGKTKVFMSFCHWLLRDVPAVENADLDGA